MPYNIVLISAICQYESAIGIHLAPPSDTSLPPPTPWGGFLFAPSSQNVADEEGGAFSQRLEVPLGRVSKHRHPHTPVCAPP